MELQPWPGCVFRCLTEQPPDAETAFRLACTVVAVSIRFRDCSVRVNARHDVCFCRVNASPSVQFRVCIVDVLTSLIVQSWFHSACIILSTHVRCSPLIFRSVTCCLASGAVYVSSWHGHGYRDPGKLQTKMTHRQWLVYGDAHDHVSRCQATSAAGGCDGHAERHSNGGRDMPVVWQESATAHEQWA